MTVTGAHVGLLFLAVVALCVGMAWKGSARAVRKQIAEANRPAQPFVDWELYHFGPAHAAHIERVERELLASLKGDQHV